MRNYIKGHSIGKVENHCFLLLLLLLLFVCLRQGFRKNPRSFGACPGTSSCRPGWPKTHRDLPASVSRVLGLKACATTARPVCVVYAPVSMCSHVHMGLCAWDKSEMNLGCLP